MRRLLSWFERKKYTRADGEIEVPSVIANEFVPQSPLEELLIEAGYEVAARPAFETAFLESEVLIAIRDDGQPDGPLENGSDGISLYTLEGEDGLTYPIGFTALDRGYACFGPDTVMARLSGHQLVQMIASSGLWVNPASPFGVLWSPEELQRMLSSRSAA